ncbi:xylosidase glycosyl [Moniliophthora roreri]|nr:xylosidase glycosyl [Moniliophthora roreri]
MTSTAFIRFKYSTLAISNADWPDLLIARGSTGRGQLLNRELTGLTRLLPESQCLPSTGGNTGGDTTASTTTAAPPHSSSFTNPIANQSNTWWIIDYSSCAPVLRTADSQKKVSWEIVDSRFSLNGKKEGHSVPRLDFNSNDYNLPSCGQAYVQGIWASTMRYRGCTSYKT